MLSISLVALDATIIATAVPSVVASLGGFSQFPWLFSIYLLAQAVSVPLFGKFADLFGRKPVMMAGIAIFLVGSILCGFAWNMTVLILFRAIQGIGAGAIQPISMTIAGDIYTLEERARVQGYLASVWAMSAVVGPTLGGVFAEYVSWRWIFFVNIPFCVLAAWILLRNLKEDVPRTKHKIDYGGALLLTLGCSLLMLGLLEGGQRWGWGSATSISIFVVGALILTSFIALQRRVSEPILPLWVFRSRLLVGGSVVSLVVGAVLLGLTSYVPTYVQIALGNGPLVAGFALATLTIGWPLSASLSGRLYLRIGFRNTSLIGGAIVIIGCGLTVSLSENSALWEVALFVFVVGLGMGLVASPTLVAVQSSVEWGRRGVVTGTNMFSRSIGSALGVAVFGAIANATLNAEKGDPSATAITTASHHVFLGGAILSVVLVAGILVMPGRSEVKS